MTDPGPFDQEEGVTMDTDGMGDNELEAIDDLEHAGLPIDLPPDDG